MRQILKSAAVVLVLLLGASLAPAVTASANVSGRTKLTFEDPVIIRTPLGTRGDYLIRINLRPRQCIVLTRLTFRDPSGDKFYLRDFRTSACANRSGVLRYSGGVHFKAGDESGTWLTKVFWKTNSGATYAGFDYFQVDNRT